MTLFGTLLKLPLLSTSSMDTFSHLFCWHVFWHFFTSFEITCTVQRPPRRAVWWKVQWLHPPAAPQNKPWAQKMSKFCSRKKSHEKKHIPNNPWPQKNSNFGPIWGQTRNHSWKAKKSPNKLWAQNISDFGLISEHTQMVRIRLTKNFKLLSHEESHEKPESKKCQTLDWY